MNHLGDTNKMVSETPRTNQVSIRPQYGDEWDWCRADFARQLERELNAANQHIKRLEEAGDFLSHYLREMPYASSYLAQIDERILRINNWREAKEDKL